MAKAKPGTRQAQLNKLSPTADKVKLGDVLGDLIVQNNALLTDLTALRAKLNTNMLTKAGLAIKAGASALAKTAIASAALVGGVPVYIAANTDMAPLLGTLATASSAAWAFYVDAAGVITTSEKTASVATHALAVAAIPAPPASKAMIGFIVVTNATGSNFVGGTTALDAASLTVTYYDATGPAVYADVLASVAVAGLENRT
jgi:hypothetical protein